MDLNGTFELEISAEEEGEELFCDMVVLKGNHDGLIRYPRVLARWLVEGFLPNADGLPFSQGERSCTVGQNALGYAGGLDDMHDVGISCQPHLPRMRSCCKICGSHDVWHGQELALCDVDTMQDLLLCLQDGALYCLIRLFGLLLLRLLSHGIKMRSILNATALIRLSVMASRDEATDSCSSI